MLEHLDKANGKIENMKTLSNLFAQAPVTERLSENIGDRDNQQERLVKLARLAMLIECEGSITIGMTPPTKTRNRPALYATVDFTNTSLSLVQEGQATLSREEVGFTARPKRYGKGFGRKLRYDTNIHGFDRVEKVLSLILPFMSIKTEQAKIVLEFIQSRREAQRGESYSDREWQLVQAIRMLNGKMPHRKSIAKAQAFLESPESICRPRVADFYRRYVKMCADLQRNLESVAEMPTPTGLLQ
jgi:hypothetical protein